MDIDPDEFISRAVQNIKKLDQLDARMVLQDLYETEYGIYNHFSKNKSPFASVRMNAGEDINDGSLLEEVIRTYSHKRIHDIFRISLIEFMELPMDIVQMLFLIADEEMSKKTSEISKIQDDFEKHGR